VWSLTFHPLGHILVTASNDHTTRFWSRERPGDATSVFSGGGEKPPEVVEMSGQDDDEEVMVPGFNYGGEAGGGVGASGNETTGLNTSIGARSGAGKWWGNASDGFGLGISSGNPLSGPSLDNQASRAHFPDGDAMNSDDFIPGLGAADYLNLTAPSAAAPAFVPVGPRQSGSLVPDLENNESSSGGNNWDDDSRGGRRGGHYDRRRGRRRY